MYSYIRMIIISGCTGLAALVAATSQAITRQKIPAYTNASFHAASASALPFANHSFDEVVSANSFHYFDHPDAALLKVKHVLKPNGKVVILDWCKDCLLCRICDVLLKRFDPAYRQCYSQAEFHQLLTAAGFELSCTTRVRFGLGWGLICATALPTRSQHNHNCPA